MTQRGPVSSCAESLLAVQRVEPRLRDENGAREEPLDGLLAR